MRANLTACAAATVALVLVGCKKSHDLAGSWEIQEANASATFNPGGTFSIAASKGGIDTSIKGTYTLTDKALTMTNQDFKVSTKTKELDSMVPQLQQAEDRTKGLTVSKVISWDGDDRFALFEKGDNSFKGRHVIFVRKK